MPYPVRRDDAGRGGSVFLHDKVRVGDRLVLGYPVQPVSRWT